MFHRLEQYSMERPLADKRPIGPIFGTDEMDISAEEIPRPEPPEAGRTNRYTEEEILDFMDRAYNHPWVIEQARGTFRGLTGLDPDNSPKSVNLMKLSTAAGLIGADSIDARRDVDEIVEYYKNERNIETP